VNFNISQSLLYFYYPQLAEIMGDAALNCESYAIVSVGPDLKDSFIVYFSIPRPCLPASAAQFGILKPFKIRSLTPTNGVISAAIWPAFGPEAHVARMVGGGTP